jgi:protein tyrosine/serine phosphatase
MTRHIDFDGIENFRDFGGYATACGRGLKRGVLYRSGAHHLATEEDLARLKALGVTAIVDLRQPHERARDPSRRWSGFDARVIENDLVSEHTDWLVKLRANELTPEWFFEDTRQFYAHGPLEPRHIELFSRWFHALAEAKGPMLVHCAAGKDRTGMICALTHHLAGVHRDDMIADFLMTNDEARIERKMASLAAFLAEALQLTVPDAALRTAVSVHPAYLETAFQVMADAHGSVDGYLEQALGVDSALRARIQERVLA